jgi:uncharacterized iron-regulated protein
MPARPAAAVRLLAACAGLALAGGLLAAPSPAAAKAKPVHSPPAAMPPCRIFALNSEGAAAPLSFAQLMGELAGADVVVCGEYHDDPNSHKMELALLEGFAQMPSAVDRTRPVAMSLEMFERDVQPAVWRYLVDGSSSDSAARQAALQAFLATTRPWPNYDRDYKPLVEYCRAHGLSVYGSNAPTALARRVAKEGWATVEPVLTTEEHSWLAESTTAPDDGYWERFKSFMGGSGGDSHGSGMSEEQINHFYEAQCLKDDTMAETITRAVTAHEPGVRDFPSPLRMIHFNGSFHSDYGYGVAQRVRQRLPQSRVYTIALRPTPDFTPKSDGGSLDPQGETLADGTPVADFIIFVPAPPAPPA